MMAAVSEIKSICDQGVAVALADVRYPNGSDPELMALLNDAGILNKLAAYAGWNTAGNTMGTTLAMASAWRAASLQPRPAPHLKAHRAFLWERVADDWGYQSVIRQEIETIISRQGSDCLNLGKNHSNAEKIVHSYMQDWAAATWQRGSWPGHMPKMHIRLPWPRTFEVDIRAI
jgi:hypothetical protein